VTGIDVSRWERFQILSLDGGGIKGLFAAAVLAAIEADLGLTVVESFDLIAGTSTGGIIALGLGLGMRPREIVDFYVEEGPRIFSNPLGWRAIQQLFFRKYSDKPLAAALKRCFGDRRFGESNKRLIVTSFNLGEDDVYLFRTPHLPRLRRDYRVPAWEIAMATAAAPTYFQCARQIVGQRLIDGGVWANNPTMVALVEAHELGAPPGATSVLNIGTSDPVVRRRPWLNSGGLLPWALSKAAIDVVLRGQSKAADNQAGHLLGRDKVLRLSPPVPESLYRLDDARATEDLIASAAHHSRAVMPLIHEQFMSHRAPLYVPCSDQIGG